MPAPSTTDGFLDIVRKSGLIESDDLDVYLRQNEGVPEQPYKLATMMVRQGLLTHFQARQLLQGRFQGFLFGKYRVLDQLGDGGMGAVYLCEHLLLRRPVAIKILPKDKVSDPVCMQRFYREARAAAALNHRNIVRAHDVDHEGSLHFLVMEFVDGKSLQDLVVEHGPLSPRRVINYLRQTATGLAHAHECGLVHRDIKPANLLLDRHGTVKILDMGLARFNHRAGDGLTELLDEHVILGTADYIAPEQAMNSHAVDGRADIYSLGATGYFLLAGRAPFDSGNVAQKLLAHQLKQPLSLRDLCPDAPDALVDVIEWMMQKRPEERPQSAVEVMQALARLDTGAIAPPSETEMPRRNELARLVESSLATLSAPAVTNQPASQSGYRLKFTAPPAPPMSPAARAEHIGLFESEDDLENVTPGPVDRFPFPNSERRRQRDTAPLPRSPRTERTIRNDSAKLVWALLVLALFLLGGAAAVLLWLLTTT